jgi:DNA-binding cell septation regulator SpoVG
MNKELKIEKIEIKEVKDKGNLKAYVKATINDLSISDMKIVEGQNGMFVSMPSREYLKDGVKKYSSYVFIEDEKQREELNRVILSKFSGQAVPQEIHAEQQRANDTPYIEFGQEIELTNDDIAF